MAETCAFSRNCPMDVDVIEVSGACAESRGEKCGKVAAYGMLKWQFEELVTLDCAEPIDGTFTITDIPGGFPPEEIRKEWVGVELPIRSNRCVEDGRVNVSPADAILSLLNNGRLDAAYWFIEAGMEFAPFGHSWTFNASEGELQTIDPISSTEYYGLNFTPPMREAMEQ